MKKQSLLVVLISLLVVVTLAFVACENIQGIVDNIMGEQGGEQEQKVDYQAPQITASEQGLEVSLEGVETFEYKLDDGEWTPYGQVIPFSQEIGAHVLTAKVNAENAGSIQEAIFTYQTKAVVLSEISVQGFVASWTAQGKSVMLKVGEGEFAPAGENSYTATAECAITVKALGGWDAENSILYVGEVEKSASFSAVALAKPILSVSEGKLVWQPVEHATKYQVKVNEGEFADATEWAIPAVAGEYAISVKAIGNGVEFSDSQVAEFALEVKASSLEYEKTAPDKVNIKSFEGAGMMLEYLGEYKNISELPFTLPYLYEATESCTAKAKVLGGWDEANKIMYLESEYSIDLVALASANLVVEDAEGKVAADFADEWTIKKYTDNWVDCGASIAVASGMQQGSSAQFNLWDNYTVFRFGRKYSAQNGYNAISFDVKGDGVTKMRVQLMDSTSGVYMTYSLGGASNGETLPNYWQHMVISMTDEDWKLNYGGNKLTFAQAKQYVGMINESEIIPFFDTINFIFYGETANGNSTKLFFDNIAFEKDVAQTKREQVLFDLSEVYTAQNANGVVFKLQLTNLEGTKAILSSLNLESNVSSEVSVEMGANNVVTIKDVAYAGQGITAQGEFVANGAIIKCNSASGQMASLFTQGMNFEAVRKVEGFESYTETGVGYDQSHTPSQISGLRAMYYADYYSGNSGSVVGGNGWSLMGSADYIQLASSGFSGSKSMKLKASTAGAMRYLSIGLADGSAQVIGKASNFGLFVKGVDIDVTMTVKVIYTNQLTPSNQQDTSIMTVQEFKVPANSDWTQYVVETNPNKDIYGYVLQFKATSKAVYLLVDDIELFAGNPHAKYISQVDPTQFGNLAYAEDFSSCSVSAGSGDASKVPSTIKGTADIYARNDTGAGYDDNKYITAKYANTGSVRSNTITITPAEMGHAEVLSFAIANDRNGNALKVTVTVKVFDYNEQVVKEESFDMEAGAVWALKEFEFGKALVKKVQIIIATTASPKGDAYAKVDNIQIKVKEQASQPTTVLSLGFDDGTTGSAYNNSAWTQYKYTSSWETMASSQMNSREKAGSKAVNFVGGYSQSRKFIYNENGSAIGEADYLSIDLGNDFSGAGVIKFKIVLVDTNGQMHYVFGSADAYEQIAGGTAMTKYEKQFDKVNVKSFYIVVYSSANGNAYLYADNITLKLSSN